MKILITGGTGFIGQALIKILLQQNAEIKVVTRNIAHAKSTLPNTVEFITHLSLDDIESCDVVINLAGEPIADKRWSAKQKDRICQSRWQLTKQLAESIQLAKNPPHLFISGSAIGIYGRQDNTPITESFSDFHPEFTRNVCEKWENIATSASSSQTRVALLRTGIVLAKDKGALAKMLTPFKLGLGGKIGRGNQMMSWIHIHDMVRAILHIIEHQELHGPINMTAEQAVSNQDFSKVLANTLNRPCFATVPSFLLKVLLGEMSDLLLFGQNVYPEKLLKSQFAFKYQNINAAIEDLLKS